MKKLNESTKITLTLGQLKKLVKESAEVDDSIKSRIKNVLPEIIDDTLMAERCGSHIRVRTDNKTVVFDYDYNRGFPDYTTDIRIPFKVSDEIREYIADKLGCGPRRVNNIIVKTIENFIHSLSRYEKWNELGFDFRHIEPMYANTPDSFGLAINRKSFVITDESVEEIVNAMQSDGYDFSHFDIRDCKAYINLNKTYFNEPNSERDSGVLFDCEFSSIYLECLQELVNLFDTKAKSMNTTSFWDKKL